MSEDFDGVYPSAPERGTHLTNGHHAVPDIQDYASRDNGYGRVSSSTLKIVDIAREAPDMPSARRIYDVQYGLDEHVNYDTLEEGEWDPFAGRRVAKLIAKLSDRVVYLDGDGFVQWDHRSGLLADGAAEVFNRLATLEAVPADGLPAIQRQTYQRLIGEAVAKFVVDESAEDAMIMLDGAETYGVARKRERVRVWFFTTAILLFVTVLMVAGACAFARITSIIRLDDAGFSLVLAAVAGATGAFVSLGLRSHKLCLDPSAGRALHTIDCCLRLVVSALVTTLFALSVRTASAAVIAYLVAPGYEPFVPISWIVIASLLVGSVERIVPSLLTRPAREVRSAG